MEKERTIQEILVKFDDGKIVPVRELIRPEYSRYINLLRVFVDAYFAHYDIPPNPISDETSKDVREFMNTTIK